eukprot:15328348-Ditylum_brightwellii.AAC.1
MPTIYTTKKKSRQKKKSSRTDINSTLHHYITVRNFSRTTASKHSPCKKKNSQSLTDNYSIQDKPQTLQGKHSSQSLTSSKQLKQ